MASDCGGTSGRSQQRRPTVKRTFGVVGLTAVVAPILTSATVAEAQYGGYSGICAPGDNGPAITLTYTSPFQSISYGSDYFPSPVVDFARVTDLSRTSANRRESR